MFGENVENVERQVSHCGDVWNIYWTVSKARLEEMDWP